MTSNYQSRLRKIILLSALLAYFPSSAKEESFPEPFGLSWQMSESKLVEIGFSANEDNNNSLRVLTSVTVPKAWTKGNIYVAVTFDKKLVKVAVISKDFVDDIYGREGKESYEEMKRLLRSKYGNPSSTYERTGGKLYKDADEFYQCLNYTGCGGYQSLFKYAGGTISIQLEGKRRGAGNLVITYESPYFTKAKLEIEKSNAIANDDAF